MSHHTRRGASEFNVCNMLHVEGQKKNGFPVSTFPVCGSRKYNQAIQSYALIIISCSSIALREAD